MSNKSFDFFANEQPKPSKESGPKGNFDFFDLPEGQEAPKEEISFDEQSKTAPGLFAREGAAQVYAAPHIAGEGWRFLAGKLQELGEEQAAKSGRLISPEEKEFTTNIVNFLPDLIKQAGEKWPDIFPTYEQAKEKLGNKIEENIGTNLPEKGRTFGEKFAEGAGKGSAAFASGGSGLFKAAATATSALTEAADLSEKNKLIGNMSIPAIASVVEAVVRRRYNPVGAEARSLARRGRDLGMTDEQLAPILASEGQVARHGKFAAGTRTARTAFEESHQALTNVLEELPTRAEAAVPLSANAERTFLQGLQDVEDGIRGRTLNLNPEEAAIADYIRDVRHNVASNGATPGEIIGTWRSINGMRGGRSALNQMKPAMLEAIESVSPQLARDFQTTNRLYSRYLTNLGEINPTQFNTFVNAGEAQQLIGAVFSGDPAASGRGFARHAYAKAIRQISAQILTNPTAQSLVRNMGKAVRDGRATSAKAVGVQLKNYVQKNLPDQYKEIDWKELGIED